MEWHMTPTTAPSRMAAWLEQAWTVRYLNRGLSGEEVTWFESYVLDKPELLATIESDTRLRDALAAEASARHKDRSVDSDGRQGGAKNAPGIFASGASADLDSPDAQDSPLRSGRGPYKVRESAPPVWLAAAATLVVGLGVGAFVALAFDSGAPAVIASPTRIVYDTMRGPTVPPRVENSSSDSAYVLIEAAVPLGASDVTIELAGQPAQPVSVSADGFATLLVAKKSLLNKLTLHYRLAAAPSSIDLPLPPL